MIFRYIAIVFIPVVHNIFKFDTSASNRFPFGGEKMCTGMKKWDKTVPKLLFLCYNKTIYDSADRRGTE